MQERSVVPFFSANLHSRSEIGRRWHWPFGPGKALRALAALHVDDLSNLSEAGRRLRREAQQQLRMTDSSRARRAGGSALPTRSR